MAELVYPPVIAFAKTMFRLLGMKITVDGAEHVPATGGAVIACNHVSYLDFIFCGLGAQPAKRLVQLMAQDPLLRHRAGGTPLRRIPHTPTSRDARLGPDNEPLPGTQARAGGGRRPLDDGGLRHRR